MVKPILEMKNITKRFPGVVANNKVNLTLYPGEVHALLGENGAGKSTLMNVLTGIYAPNEGELFFKGEKIELKSPKTAVDLGIGMVHQHFKLIEPLTVAENIYMPSKNCKFMLNLKEMNERITELSTQFNLPVDPKAKIWQLAVGEQQRVEIVKLLFNGAEILILDEPTAVLTPQESRALFANLRGLADEGKAVLFISHKLYEVIENADRITVLRGGESVATMLNKDLNQDDLVSVMVGKRLEMAASTREVLMSPNPAHSSLNKFVQRTIRASKLWITLTLNYIMARFSASLVFPVTGSESCARRSRACDRSPRVQFPWRVKRSPMPIRES